MVDDNLSDMYKYQNLKEMQGHVNICHWSPGKSSSAAACQDLCENEIQVP